jgi:hypothetical protein
MVRLLAPACFVAVLTAPLRPTAAEPCWNARQHRMVAKGPKLEASAKGPWERLDKASKTTLAGRLADKELAKAITEGLEKAPYEGPQLQQLGKDSYAVTWTDFSTLYLGLASGTPLTVKRKLALAKTRGDWNPSWANTALMDIDGDRKPELLVYYRRCASFMPGSGCSSETILGIYTVPDLKRQGELVVGEFGALAARGDCEAGDVIASDPRCTGNPDLFVKLSCKDRSAGENSPEQKLWEIYSYQKDTDRFVAWKPDSIKKIKDDKPWVVLVESFPLYLGNGDKLAQQLKDKLTAAGFADAQIHHSAAFAKLACCYSVVIAGRFKTRAEAAALVKQLKAKKLSGYAKQAF